MARRKRPVKLTLNAALIARARQQRCIAETDVVRQTVATWNRFAEKQGSFADEHSTL